MPFRPQILHLEPKSLTDVDTSNVIHLHRLWSGTSGTYFRSCPCMANMVVLAGFSKCSDMLEEGRRYENMSWRIFSRESFCCRAPVQSRSLPSSLSAASKRSTPVSEDVPELSSSLESDSSSNAHMDLATHSCPTSARPELRRIDSASRKEKHLSPLDLEKIVISIKQKNTIEPLSPLPASLTVQPPTPAEPTAPAQPVQHVPEPQRQEATPTPSPLHSQIIPDSSTSTVATAIGSDYSEMSLPLVKTDSTSTEVSATSIVRGFSKDHISSSARSRVQLAPASQSPSILKPSPGPRPPTPQKRKKATFQIGDSSGEGDESSFETRYGTRSSLSEGLKQSKKVTSFKDEVLTHAIQDKTYESEEVFEESDEEEQSESAIEDDDDVEEEWEDEDEASDAPPMDEKEMFQRVDSRPNLTSRRSLLTTMMHEKDRAAALQNAASKSTSAIVPTNRRSRTSSPNGPLGTSPAEEDIPEAFRSQLQPSRAKPIIMTTSNTHSLALSPRTTRRNMMQSELTESVRKNLLWERQNKKPPPSKSSASRLHTSNDVKSLRELSGDAQSAPYLNPLAEAAENPKSWNQFFDAGLQEYHQKGW